MFIKNNYRYTMLKIKIQKYQNTLISLFDLPNNIFYIIYFIKLFKTVLAYEISNV